MANFAPQNRFRRPVTQTPDVELTRRLFNEGMFDKGMNSEKATEYANTEAAKILGAQSSSGETAGAVAERAFASGGTIADQKRRHDVPIPEDWEDWPWPKLRDLASRIKGAPVKDREDAERVIKTALAPK